MIDSTAREKGAARRVREMESISQVRRLEGLASSLEKVLGFNLEKDRLKRDMITTYKYMGMGRGGTGRRERK